MVKYRGTSIPRLGTCMSKKDESMRKQLVKRTTENQPNIKLKIAKAKGARWIRNRRLI